VGKPEGKITIARHEYRQLPSAVTILIRVKLIVLWRSALQNFHLIWDPNKITIFKETDCKP
jgi:hypothetical protein